MKARIINGCIWAAAFAGVMFEIYKAWIGADWFSVLLAALFYGSCIGGLGYAIDRTICDVVGTSSEIHHKSNDFIC